LLGVNNVCAAGRKLSDLKSAPMADVADLRHREPVQRSEPGRQSGTSTRRRQQRCTPGIDRASGPAVSISVFETA
jgi:hypothetical protein